MDIFAAFTYFSLVFALTRSQGVSWNSDDLEEYERCRSHYAQVDSEIEEGYTSEIFDVLEIGNETRILQGLMRKIQTWPNGRIPAVLEEGMNDELKSRIKCATIYFTSQSCVKFVRVEPNDTDFLAITTTDKGCYTEYIGRVEGGQILNLDATNQSCWRHGTLIHLMMHALGFVHEHQRNDRHQYVVIHDENIDEEDEIHYKTAHEAGLELPDVGKYDFESIMHTGRFQGSEDPVMTAKVDYGVQYKVHQEMGKKQKASKQDTLKLNKLYCGIRKTASHLWPNGIVPTVIEPGLPTDQMKRLECAVNFFTKHTCVRFIPKRTDHGNYLYIGSQNSGCFANSIGQKEGRNEVNLDSRVANCWKHGVIIHQLMHAIGLIDEQTRPDRDEYIDINWENIPQHLQHHFKKTTEQTVLGSYDYASIMHYSRDTFGVDNTTMSAKKEPFELNNELMGNTLAPTQMDTYKVNNLYNCEDTMEPVEPQALVLDDCMTLDVD